MPIRGGWCPTLMANAIKNFHIFKPFLIERGFSSAFITTPHVENEYIRAENKKGSRILTPYQGGLGIARVFREESSH